MTQSFCIIIPARFGSSRLPGKPLLPIAGKPMIQHVFERAKASGASEIIVATDDQRIAKIVDAFGGQYVMTAKTHTSGTDRLAEVIETRQWDDEQIIVNLQGDEPLMDPALLHQVATALNDNPEAGMATIATPISSQEEVFNPNIVKVVIAKNGYALYFSRAAIPWVRDTYGQETPKVIPGIPTYRHLGLYAYRVKTLKQITTMPTCDLENAESLEQLRPLWHGVNIYVSISDTTPAHGVDTAEDLNRVEQLLTRQETGNNGTAS